jgi:uncharacterized membrane protein
MEDRPRIKLIISELDKSLESIALAVLLIMWGLTLYSFIKSPTTVPTHFNASGHVDDYGNRTTILILPILATVLYFGLTWINKYPHVFNYMTTITKDNAERQYTIATRMIRFLKLVILVIFTLIILFTYLTTVGITNGLGVWFLPVVIGLTLIPTIILLTQSLKNRKP